MASSEIEYDVFSSPRIGAIQFGDFVAADGSEKEAILRSAKFFKRTHRARAFQGRQAISSFLASPSPKVGDLDFALSEATAATEDIALTEQQQKDAEASRDSLSGFLKMDLFNQAWFGGREVVAISDDQPPLAFGGVSIITKLACLVRSTSKSGVEQVGAILLNTQKGKGLGQRPETQSKRKKAGETVALLALRQVMNQYSDFGEPHPKDTLHVYLRASHFWPAPKSYAQRLSNMEADARSIRDRWDAIQPPDDFDPDKARSVP